jgi:hypothetical protein
MTPLSLKELRDVAEKATQGEWSVEDPLADTLSIVEAAKETYEWRFIANCTMPDEDDHDFTGSEVKANAKHIATFDPPTVKRLIAIAEAARTFLAKVDECQPHIDNAFKMEFVRGRPYTGPQYGTERDALRKSLEGITL